MTLVSILMPTIGRDSIVEAAESIAAQDYPHHAIEVVMCIDGPVSDHRRDSIRAAGRLLSEADIAVRQVQLSRNWRTTIGRGVCEVPMAVAGYLASGDVLVVLADDDAFPPNFLSKYVERMDRDPDLDLLIGPQLVHDTDHDRTILPRLGECGLGYVTVFMWRPRIYRFGGTWNPGFGIGAEVELAERWRLNGARWAIDINLPPYIFKTRGFSNPKHVEPAA